MNGLPSPTYFFQFPSEMVDKWHGPYKSSVHFSVYSTFKELTYKQEPLNRETRKDKYQKKLKFSLGI